MEISEQLVGRRVSLRHRIGQREGRPLYSDAVGELSADGPTAVLVQTRRGAVRVERAAVVAVRAVPPAPERRASLAAIVALEGLCADAWPAVIDRPLGAWRLRAAGAISGVAGTARANSALAIGDPGVPVAAALDAVRAFAREHGIPARVQVPVGSPWDRAVGAQGWIPEAGRVPCAVLVAPLDALASQRTALSSEPFRRGGSWSPALGQVRATVVQDHLYLSLLEVAPAARRRGLASALLAAAARWGRECGARWGVAQVALDITGACALYDRLDFVEHHRYRYLVPE